MVKNKTAGKHLKPPIAFWVGSFILLVLISVFYTFRSSQKKTVEKIPPSPILQQVTPTESILPTIITPTKASITQFAPTSTPVPLLYSIDPRPSKNISMTVSTPGTGYGIFALLIKSGAVVTDQNTKKYVWSIRDPNLATITPQSACTNGIQSPCPQDHLFIYGQQPGSTIITVEVIETEGSIHSLTSTTFDLTITTP